MNKEDTIQAFYNDAGTAVATVGTAIAVAANANALAFTGAVALGALALF